MAKEVVRTKELDALALNLYKHFQFSPSLITEKVQDPNYSESRIRTCFIGLRKFVKTGERHKKLAPNAFYDAVQECIDKHVAQLTPKASEKCQSRGQYTRKPKAPVKVYKEETSTTKRTGSEKITISPEVLKMIHDTNKVNAVGILVGSNIKLFENEDILNGYLQCLNDLKPQLTDNIEWQVIDLSYSLKK